MVIKIIVLIVYLVSLVSIGVYSSRRAKTYADYNLAGRANNKWITGISTQASSTSGWMLLGMPGAAYALGYGVYWIMLGWLTGALFNWLYLAKRLRLETEKHDAVTLVNFFEKISNDKTGQVALVSSISVIVLMIINSSAEIIGCGKLLAASFGIDYTFGVTVSLVIVMIYTFLGGYLAVSWTNLIQGTMMFLALLIVPIVLLSITGGFDNMTMSMYQQDPNLFKYLSGTTGFWNIVAFITGGFGIAFMYPGMIHATTGLIAIKDANELKFSTLIAIIWGVTALLGASAIGMVGRSIFPNVPDPENILVLLANEFFPPFIIALVMSAVLAAILSSVCAYIIIAAASICANAAEKYLKTGDDKKIIVLEKTAIIIIAIAAYALALQGGAIYSIALFAASGLGASFGPITIAGAWGYKVHKNAAVASILLGLIVVIAWHYAGLSDLYLYEVFPGWIASTLALVLINKAYGGPEASIAK